MRRFGRYLRDLWWLWTEGFDNLRRAAVDPRVQAEARRLRGERDDGYFAPEEG